MKNITINSFLTFLIFFSTFLNAQILFKKNVNDTVFNKAVFDRFQSIHDLDVADQVFALNLDTVRLNSIMNNDNQHLQIRLPFISNTVFELEEFSVFSDSLNVIRHTAGGIIKDFYLPRIKTYKIMNLGEDISGSFIFSYKGVKAVINSGGQIYQIDKIKFSHPQASSFYIFMNINSSPVEFDFKCAHDDLTHIDQDIDLMNHRAQHSDLGCVEIAIEIDYYTFQSFQNFQDAIDWSLEMIAVTHDLFQGELSVGLTSNTAYVWEVEDPHINFIEEPQSMLSSIRDNWTNNEDFVNIDRDLAHLFSKRNNTGTGGIAFLNGIGSAWNGYGFSSNLTDENDYLGLPVPYFFWNIYCLSHELGHNFGAKHTQWCGWPGGPIDNCTNIEEIVPGECEEYTNNPSPQVGTIMSYCHTWSFNEGGGLIMKFHETVKYSVLPYIGLQDLTTCDDSVIYGCLDVNACNYNVDVNEDDGSCTYAVSGFDCFGNCLNDLNQDGICDDNLELDNNLASFIFLYPNPTDDYLQVQYNQKAIEQSDLYIFNSMGQLILSKNNLKENTKINVSFLPKGLYNAHLLLQDDQIIQNIIIN